MSEKEENKHTDDSWKFWLGVAIFVIFIISINKENNSSKGEARTEQLYRSAVQNIYSDTYNSCQEEGNHGVSYCQEEARHQQKISEHQLGTLLGK